MFEIMASRRLHKIIQNDCATDSLPLQEDNMYLLIVSLYKKITCIYRILTCPSPDVVKTNISVPMTMAKPTPTTQNVLILIQTGKVMEIVRKMPNIYVPNIVLVI